MEVEEGGREEWEVDVEKLVVSCRKKSRFEV
jgi:hypothetical protein